MTLVKRKERIRFLRFAIVGTVGAAVDFIIFNLFATVLKVPALPASMISFVAAVVNNFFLNRMWTYPESRSKRIGRQIGQFFLVSIAGLLIRALLFYFLENPIIGVFQSLLSVNLEVATIIGHNITLALAILIVMTWNFIANRYWTFNDVE